MDANGSAGHLHGPIVDSFGSGDKASPGDGDRLSTLLPCLARRGGTHPLGLRGRRRVQRVQLGGSMNNAMRVKA